MWQSMKIRSYAVPRCGGAGGVAIVDDIDDAAHAPEHLLDDHLVHRVVLGQQDVRRQDGGRKVPGPRACPRIAFFRLTSNQKVEPSSSRLSTPTWPPMSSAIS